MSSFTRTVARPALQPGRITRQGLFKMNTESKSKQHNETTRYRSGYQRVIGIDVSKDKLDIHDSQGTLTGCIGNDPKSIEKKIIKELDVNHSILILCESTGSYHLTLMDTVHESSIDMAVVNGRQVRDLAKGHGRLEKTDPIDAEMICRFGQDVQVQLTVQRSESQKHHAALVKRRQSLLKMQTQEKSRLEHTTDKKVRRLIEQLLKYLQKQLKSVDKELEKILKELAKEEPTVDILLSHKGVGVVTTSVLLTHLPELGTLNRKEAAKLVGLNPMANQSGKKDGKRSVRGGRQRVRNALYMAAHSARQHDPRMKAFYNRLKDQGQAI